MEEIFGLGVNFINLEYVLKWLGLFFNFCRVKDVYLKLEVDIKLG